MTFASFTSIDMLSIYDGGVLGYSKYNICKGLYSPLYILNRDPILINVSIFLIMKSSNNLVFNDLTEWHTNKTTTCKLYSFIDI